VLLDAHGLGHVVLGEGAVVGVDEPLVEADLVV